MGPQVKCLPVSERKAIRLTFSPPRRGDIAVFANHMKDIICRGRIQTSPRGLQLKNHCLVPHPFASHATKYCVKFPSLAQVVVLAVLYLLS